MARYLRPEEAVVGFRDRPELAELLEWCVTAGGGGGPVAGSAGAGKTRVALRLGGQGDGGQRVAATVGAPRPAAARPTTVGAGLGYPAGQSRRPGTAAEVVARLTGGLGPAGSGAGHWARRVALDPGAATPADISRLHDTGLTD